MRYKELINLFPELRKRQLYLLFICFLSIFFENYTLFQIQKLIDLIVSQATMTAINVRAVYMLALGIVSFMIDAYQMKVWHTFSKYLENNMRYVMTKNFFYKDISFMNNENKGNLASKLLNDGNGVAGFIGLTPLMIIINLARIVSILFILGGYSLKLTLIIIILTPFYIIATILVNGKMRDRSKAERSGFGRVQGKLLEMINGFKEIKIFGKEEYFSDLFKNIIFNDYFKTIKEVISVQVLNTALSSYIRIVFPIIILWCGAYFSLNGELSVGMLVAFYTYICKLIEPMNNLGDIYQNVKQAQGAMDRINSFLFDERKNDSNTQKLQLEHIESVSIRIDNFKINGFSILENVNTTLEKTDRLFISGESGSGKSTLVYLLLKQYTDFSGQILINDLDYSSYSNESFYQQIITVFQEPLLFAGTVKENLTLGDYFENKDIMEVLHVVNLDEFMINKDLSYELSEGANNISGGQKQRLALARALLRKPDLLILDEVTNGLDKLTEKVLVNRLDQFLRKYKMKLICISHNDMLQEICNKRIYL